MSLECWFMWEYLATANTLKRVCNQVRWHGRIFHIAVIAAKVVRVVHNKCTSTRLTLAFNHFLWLLLFCYACGGGLLGVGSGV